jgi:hypothetical protein
MSRPDHVPRPAVAEETAKRYSGEVVAPEHLEAGDRFRTFFDEGKAASEAIYVWLGWPCYRDEATGELFESSGEFPYIKLPIDAALNEAILAAIAKDQADSEAMAKATSAVTQYIRDSLRYIEHIPNRYYLHPVNKQALARLYQELDKHGRIELTDKGVPKCLVDEGIDSVEEGDPRFIPPTQRNA